ncbi:hypothetical protein DL764_005457 [Monosporascus ibericus]|uniref:Alpha/beta hydrolase fold-3 domain-containing protein n=1 Tax=Monosporascus ibericus TaxID=155417 RepID=A0A4Q4TCV4_9PEZI|nr:hypothetical protein DL764_005457 [Monosporascus ibericus]
MSGLKWDPEYEAFRNAVNPPTPPVHASALALREANNRLFSEFLAGMPFPAEVEQSCHAVTSQDGTEITVTRFATAAHRHADSPQPALVFVFGGGMVSGSVEIFSKLVAADVVASGVQFFAVGYRIAPEHPAPAAVEDVYAGLRWLSEHAAELGVDLARIGITGVSAGGGIAAGAALLARDRGLSPPLAKQVLIYPMLDDRTCTRIPPDHPLVPFLSWTRENNELGWGAYVGEDKAGRPEADVSPYAAPGRAEDLSGLPSTYIETGNLDLFRDENAEYAARLAAANVDVEFHLYPGLPHGFDYAFEIGPSKGAMENRVRAFKSF